MNRISVLVGGYSSHPRFFERCNHLRAVRERQGEKWVVKAYMGKVAVVVVTRFTAPSPYITPLLPFVM